MMRILIAALSAASCLAVPAAAGTYVFGDSSVEQGNLYALPGMARPGTPYYVRDGFSRESNGPVWIERLTPGIKPVLGAGRDDTQVNFAYSGATSGSGNIATEVPTGLSAQIEAFKARITGGSPTPGAHDLFIIAAGANDFIRDLGTIDLRTTSGQVITNLSDAATRLSAAGARRVLIEDIPNFILAPAFREIVPAGERKQLIDVMTAFTASHDAAQVAALRTLNGKLIGTYLVTVHVSKLFDHVRAHAAALGFKVIDRPCYDDTTGTLCSADPAVQNEYLFFDNLHLSERAQTIQADYYRALLGQLDGRANRVAAGIGRDVAGIVRAEAANERADRHGRWLAPTASPAGFSLISDASFTKVRNDGGVIAEHGHRNAYRLGAAYSDGEGWSIRVIGARQRGRFVHAQGDQRITGWSIAASGERRWGMFRLGASAGEFWGDASGRRDMPVALMSADYRSHVSGSYAELEGGAVIARKGLAAMPSAWLRYENARFRRYAEQGATGLEMDFPSHRFDALYAGAGVTIAFPVGTWLTPRLTLSHERRLSSGAGTVTGSLIDNSADPISVHLRPFERAATKVEPAILIHVGSKSALTLGSSIRPGKRDLGARARLALPF